MTVISDTSPILNLAAIQRLDLLQVLTQRVTIPPAVARELGRCGFEPNQSPWLEVQSVRNEVVTHKLRRYLDEGESEAIALAIEQKADLLLIDEKRGRRIATGLGLRVLGLLGLLVKAKHQGAINPCRPVLDELIATGFWVGQDLYNRFLKEVGEPVS